MPELIDRTRLPENFPASSFFQKVHERPRHLSSKRQPSATQLPSSPRTIASDHKGDPKPNTNARNNRNSSSFFRPCQHRRQESRRQRGSNAGDAGLYYCIPAVGPQQRTRANNPGLLNRNLHGRNKANAKATRKPRHKPRDEPETQGTSHARDKPETSTEQGSADNSSTKRRGQRPSELTSSSRHL